MGAPASTQTRAWACSACTLHNPTDTFKCKVCRTPNPNNPEGSWNCKSCHYDTVNAPDAPGCYKCGTSRTNTAQWICPKLGCGARHSKCDEFGRLAPINWPCQRCGALRPICQ